MEINQKKFSCIISLLFLKFHWSCLMLKQVVSLLDRIVIDIVYNKIIQSTGAECLNAKTYMVTALISDIFNSSSINNDPNTQQPFCIFIEKIKVSVSLKLLLEPSRIFCDYRVKNTIRNILFFVLNYYKS